MTLSISTEPRKACRRSFRRNLIGEASLGEATLIERIIPRMLRNILVVSVLLLGPMFWYDRWRERLGLPLGRRST